MLIDSPKTPSDRRTDSVLLSPARGAGEVEQAVAVATAAVREARGGIVSELFQAALRRRRVRIWTPVVFVVIVALGLAAASPNQRLLEAIGLSLPAATVLFVFLAALVCEYIDSSLGMGYGTALTPLLLMAGFDVKDVVPCVLLSEFVTGLTAGLMHHRDGNMDLVRDAIFAVTVAVRIPKAWLVGAIGTIITTMGVVILVTLRHQFRYRASHLITVGAVAAFNKGLSGGGYGPLVTAGQVVSGISPRQAVGITSLAESVTCLVGLCAYFAFHSKINWQLAIPLAAGALLSVPFATLTVRRMPEKWARGAVGLVTLVLGVLTLIKLIIPSAPSA
jgi:hypothetical protein